MAVSNDGSIWLATIPCSGGFCRVFEKPDGRGGWKLVFQFVQDASFTEKVCKLLPRTAKRLLGVEDVNIVQFMPTWTMWKIQHDFYLRREPQKAELLALMLDELAVLC